MTDLISALRLLTRLKSKSVHLGVTGSVACYKAVELMRAMNFYRFSNPDSQVECVWLSGGGAEIPALRKSISDTLDMEIRMADELLKSGDQIADGFDFVQAVGITLD